MDEIISLLFLFFSFSWLFQISSLQLDTRFLKDLKTLWPCGWKTCARTALNFVPEKLRFLMAFIKTSKWWAVFLFLDFFATSCFVISGVFNVIEQVLFCNVGNFEFSKRSHMTSKCGKNKDVAHLPQASVSRRYFYHIFRLLWSIHGIHLF